MSPDICLWAASEASVTIAVYPLCSECCWLMDCARQRHVYLIGDGIASLSAAVFRIRNGDIPGQNITVLEESNKSLTPWAQKQIRISHDGSAAPSSYL